MTKASAPLTAFSKGIANIARDRGAIARQAFRELDVLILPTTAAGTPTVKDAAKNALAWLRNRGMMVPFFNSRGSSNARQDLVTRQPITRRESGSRVRATSPSYATSFQVCSAAPR